MSKSSLLPLLSESLIAYYWIGFLMADGCLKKSKQLSLNCCIKDKNHLIKFSRFINSRIHIHKLNNNNFLKKKRLRVETTILDSKNIINLIKKFDFKSRKTYNPPNIKTLSKTLKSKNKFIAFLLGFIDGDGCVIKRNNRIIYIKIELHKSWVKVLRFLSQKLYFIKFDSKISKVKIYKKRNSIRLNIGIGPTQKILNFIKNNKIIPIMERKWG